MDANSGLYWGMNAVLSLLLSIYSLTLTERCMEALSSIKKQRFGSTLSFFAINLTNSRRKSIKSSEDIVPFRFAAITPPEVVIAVTKDHEFLNQMLLMICSLLLGIQEKSLFVSLEKEDSSMFISISNLLITFHSFIENHCLIQI